jgi:hypothetical protein
MMDTGDKAAFQDGAAPAGTAGLTSRVTTSVTTGLTNGRLLASALLVAMLGATVWWALAPGPTGTRILPASGAVAAGPAVGAATVRPVTQAVTAPPVTHAAAPPPGPLAPGAANAPLRADAASPQPGWAEVMVDAMGGAAEVVEGGRVIGSTPYRAQLLIGSQVRLELRRAGAQPTPVQFQVRPVDNRYDILLQRAP